MKKIYLIICVMMCAVFQAQTLNVDAYLKTKLFTYGATSDSNGNFITLDTNNDGQIQLSEASLVYKINLSDLSNAITSLSVLTEFPNLTELKLTSPNISSNLLFSNYTNLQKLIFSGGTVGNVTIENCNALNIAQLGAPGNIINIQNTSVQEVSVSNINGFNISTVPNLKKLSVGSSTMTSLNLSNLPALEEVNVSQNQLLTNINFAGDTALKKLELYRNKLNSLSIPNPSLVNYLSISFNLFQTFDATPYTGLGMFLANDNQITSLDFSSSPLIGVLYIYNNNLTTLTLHNNPILSYLYANDNHITNIAFDQAKGLKGIQVMNNSLTNIDLSKQTILDIADLDNNLNLQTLNLKNGKHNYLGIGFSNTPQLQYVCTDPIETSYIMSQLASYNQPNTVANSYCSFTPGGSSYFTLQGKTRYDMNANGCDINDVVKPFQKFNILGQNITISDAFGSYSFPLIYGTNTISPMLENPSYFNITPPSFTTNFPTQVSPYTQNFCLTANGTHNDLEVVILPITIAQPGSDAKYKILYKNKGTTTQSGVLSFNYNDDVMNFVNSSLAPNSQSTGILNWNFSNILPFETREINFTFNLNTPTQTPPLNNSSILHYNAQINGATDDTPLDNIFTLNQAVVNSYDPNDKTCLEGASITQAKVGDYVHYLIRFENTGTANAQNIVIKDDIDGTKFDTSSLIALGASHNFVTKISANTVEFIFENIQLPYTTGNNGGYISFKIKTKSTLNVGDSFSNKAGIYFDYNAPIITNNYTTTVQNVLATSEINKENKTISIYPNPVKDVLNIQFKNEIVKAEIYDATGRILISTSVKGNSINVSELTKGNYILKLSTKDKTFTQKFIKN
ncbi:T9SS type A sorting domain-containing protein [Chryseobacterium ginsengisoli]|uniref:T9SS type A sorting domain-containing protein n=1 Tax=Chryseobacterium ginsengisoli TaxID=363853 RepID=A0ABP9MMJ1_9FLAO